MGPGLFAFAKSREWARLLHRKLAGVLAFGVRVIALDHGEIGFVVAARPEIAARLTVFVP